MRTRALAFLTLAVLTPLSVFSDEYKPYKDDFSKKEFRKSLIFESTDFGGKKYLQQVYNFIAGLPVNTDPKYPKTANMFDNTAALLGFHFGEGWQGNAQKKAFEGMRDAVMIALRDAFLKRKVDSSLVELNDDEVKKQTKALSPLLMAGISYGHIVEPNKYQPQNYEDQKKPYYAFRLGQQAIRDGVLKAYMLYVINLKSEVAWFYDRINKHCPSTKKDDRQVKLGGVDTTGDSFKDAIGKIGSIGGGVIGGGGVGFGAGFEILAKQLAGLGNVECLKLMAQLTQMKIELANMELMLALLASNYSILNNQEKEWLR